MKVLCTGGESTGTRLLTEVVGTMGVEAIHRSFPHGGAWPVLRDIDFDAAVVITRDWQVTAKSQVKVGHVKTYDEAIRNLRFAYPLILSQLGTKPYLIVSYEALVHETGDTIRTIARTLGVTPDPARLPAIRDENEKWRAA